MLTLSLFLVRYISAMHKEVAYAFWEYFSAVTKGYTVLVHVL